MNSNNKLTFKSFKCCNKISPIHFINYQFYNQWIGRAEGIVRDIAIMEGDVIKSVCDVIEERHRDVLSEGMSIGLWSMESNYHWRCDDKMIGFFIKNHVREQNTIYVIKKCISRWGNV